MGQSKIVPQGIQNKIKEEIESVFSGMSVEDSLVGFRVNENHTITAEFYDDEGNPAEQYEVIICIIPKQSAHHSEVRNG